MKNLFLILTLGVLAVGCEMDQDNKAKKAHEKDKESHQTKPNPQPPMQINDSDKE